MCWSCWSLSLFNVPTLKFTGTLPGWRLFAGGSGRPFFPQVASHSQPDPDVEAKEVHFAGRAGLPQERAGEEPPR